jgi:hypothetical protein
MRTFIPFYAGNSCANHRKTEVFVMGRRFDNADRRAIDELSPLSTVRPLTY